MRRYSVFRDANRRKLAHPTFELNLHRYTCTIKVNQNSKSVTLFESYCLDAIDRLTQLTDCCTWTTKVVDKNRCRLYIGSVRALRAEVSDMWSQMEKIVTEIGNVDAIARPTGKRLRPPGLENGRCRMQTKRKLKIRVHT